MKEKGGILFVKKGKNEKNLKIVIKTISYLSLSIFAFILSIILYKLKIWIILAMISVFSCGLVFHVAEKKIYKIGILVITVSFLFPSCSFCPKGLGWRVGKQVQWQFIDVVPVGDWECIRTATARRLLLGVLWNAVSGMKQNAHV